MIGSVEDRTSLGAAGLVLAALALAALAAQPRAAAPAATRAKAHATRTTHAAPPAHIVALRDGGRIDLNRAASADLELLPGIGPALAQRILQDRTTSGAYRSVDDLTRVAGIGPVKLARIRPLVHVGPLVEAGAQEPQRSKINTPETSAP